MLHDIGLIFAFQSLACFFPTSVTIFMMLLATSKIHLQPLTSVQVQGSLKKFTPTLTPSILGEQPDL